MQWVFESKYRGGWGMGTLPHCVSRFPSTVVNTLLAQAISDFTNSSWEEISHSGRTSKPWLLKKDRGLHCHSGCCWNVESPCFHFLPQPWQEPCQQLTNIWYWNLHLKKCIHVKIIPNNCCNINILYKGKEKYCPRFPSLNCVSVNANGGFRYDLLIFISILILSLSNYSQRFLICFLVTFPILNVVLLVLHKSGLKFCLIM